MTIYGSQLYIIADEADCVKIGMSGYPEKRLRELQSETGKTLRMVWQSCLIKIDEIRDTERRLHNHFGDRRVFGEWFDVSPTQASSAANDALSGKLEITDNTNRRRKLGSGAISISVNAFSEIADLLKPGETRTEFVQRAVETEILRREAEKRDPKGKRRVD